VNRAKSITLALRRDPVAHNALTEQSPPIFVKLLTDMDEPLLTKSKIETALPMRPNDLKEIEEPRCTESITDSFSTELTLVSPVMLIVDPNLTVPLTLTEDAARTKSKIDIAEPHLKKARTLIELPLVLAASTDIAAPILID
jgi:hypothetical protein